MARRRKAKSKTDSRIFPDDVLEGRVDVGPEELFDLIHEVNPTLRGLDKKTEAWRYRQKSALQSLLIRRFGDELLEVHATADDGVVSLDHYSGARDACHAVLDELEPDARAWVLRELDMKGSDPNDAPEPWLERLRAARPDAAGEGDDQSLLDQGRKAMAEYDYETAEQLFGRAFEKGRQLDAALALLELRVDLLGMDEPALELESRLSAPALEHPGVRGFLALAAARVGDRQAATRHLESMASHQQGVPAARVAEVQIALASHALRESNRELAALHLEKAAELDPTHREIPRLSQEIAGQRAEALRREEVELERLWAERGTTGVETEARAFVDRWPDSEVARRILRLLSEARRGRAIAEHLEQADAALADERFAEAAQHYQAALEAGSDRPDLEKCIDDAKARHRTRQEEEEIDAWLVRFRDAEPRDLLMAYLAVPRPLRPRIRQRWNWTALEWIEATGAPATGAKAQNTVAAVLALERAQDQFEEGDARGAFGTLEPHRMVLHPVEPARSLERKLRRDVARADRELAVHRLAAAWRHFEAERQFTARGVFDQLSWSDLPDEDRSRAEDLLNQFEQAEKIDRLVVEYERALQGRRVHDALAWARRVSRRLSDQEQEPWKRTLGLLRDRLHTLWCFEAVTGDIPLDQTVPAGHSREKSVSWLTQDCRWMVLANAWADWLFVSIVDVARELVVRRISLRSPERLVFPLLTFVDREQLWLLGREGRSVVLSLEDWTVWGYYHFGELAASGHVVGGVLPIPGCDLFWMDSDYPDMGDEQTTVVDIDEWRVIGRTPSRLSRNVVLPFPDGLRMLLSGDPGGYFYGAEGEQQNDGQVVPYQVENAALTANGQGLLAMAWGHHVRDEHLNEEILSGTEEEIDIKKRAARVLLRIERHGGEGQSDEGPFEITEHLILQDVVLLGFNGIVTCLEDGLSFVYYSSYEGTKKFLVYDRTIFDQGKPLDPVATFDLPGHVLVVHDRDYRHIRALVQTSRRDTLIPLSAEPPDLSWYVPTTTDYDIPYFSHSHQCGKPTGSTAGIFEQIQQDIERLPREEVTAYFHRWIAEEKWREAVLTGEVAIEKYKASSLMKARLRRLYSDQPRRGDVVLHLASRAIRKKNWEQALQLLREAEPRGLDEGRKRHFYHLQGQAFMQAGQLDEAHAAFNKGMACEGGDCALELWASLTGPMDSPPDPSQWGTDQPYVRQIAGALRTIDHARERGDDASARAVLDDELWHWSTEVQIAARAADLYLDLDATTAEERFRRRGVLARFSHLWQHMEMMRRNLYLPTVTWDDERLNQLLKRVLVAMDEL